jgi:hypothetical protein
MSDHESFRQTVDKVPIRISLEERERMRQRMLQVVSNARDEELRLARARLADWILHYQDWITAEPQLAEVHPAVQSVVIRGQVIHETLHARESPSVVERIFSSGSSEARNHVVDGLCGFGGNWRKARTPDLPPGDAGSMHPMLVALIVFVITGGACAIIMLLFAALTNR